MRSRSAAAGARNALLRWFRRHARALPWRENPSPYAVWVSEVMLQQTQVETVIPYFRRFLSALPTVTSLAEAPLERVLELWSGLGYYRRARHLHHAAQVVVEQFDGEFPRDFEQARSLPGIGGYTASAVLSIAYNLPYAVLDGNVARVLARLLALSGNLHQPEFRRRVEGELAVLLSRRRPGDFNQAMMELGQTVCLPRAPLCPKCPLRIRCQAHQMGKAESFPLPRPRRAAESRHLAAGVISENGKVAMVRGLDDGLLPDLWNFPSAFGATPVGAREHLKARLTMLARGAVEIGPPCGEVQHGITFRSIHVHIHPVELSGLPAAGTIRWVALSRLSRAAISQLARKIADKIKTR